MLKFKELYEKSTFVKRGGLIKQKGSENIMNTNKWGWDGQLEPAISKNKFVKRTLRSNHLYLIGLLIKCFRQLDKCFS